MSVVADYPAGTVAVCPKCDLELYRLTVDARRGDVVTASMVERVNAVHEPATNVPMECPEHGGVWPRWLRP